MGGCCSGDNDREGYNNTNDREQHRDDDSESSEMSGMPDDSDSENESQSQLDAPKIVVNNKSEVRKNIIQGWKNAVQSGNDSLAMTLYEDYNEYELLKVEFENGDNSLHVACSKQKMNLCFFLIKRGMNVNAQNRKTGWTALHYACDKRDVPLVKFLLANNANPELEAKDGRNPRAIAKRYRATKIVELLLEAEQNWVMGQINGKSNDLPNTDPTIRGNPSVHVARTTELHGLKLGVYTGDLLGSPKESHRGRSDSDGYSSPSEDHQQVQKKFFQQPSKSTVRQLNQIKSRDPFRAPALRAQDTKKELSEESALAAERKNLPRLEAWLEKRKPRPPYQWQKRWVIVKKSHILWSDKQRSIEDPDIADQRKVFNGFLNISVIESIKPHATKSGNKFIITARDYKRQTSREYMWKCSSKVDRDYWVDGLRKHMKFVNEIANMQGSY